MIGDGVDEGAFSGSRVTERVRMSSFDGKNGLIPVPRKPALMFYDVKASSYAAANAPVHFPFPRQAS